MQVGITREIKNNEYRVGMTPAGVELLARAGHSVFVQAGAGEGTGIPDSEYAAGGATVLPAAKQVFERCEMIIKVKEPIGPEFEMMRRGQIWFTYLHLAGDRDLARKTVATGVVGIAYETMERPDGSLPLLVPMSEVAGRLAINEGAKYVQRTFDGRGILLGGVPGTEPAQVLVLGAGVVGRHAAQMAVGMGAKVTIMDLNIDRLRELDLVYQGRLTTLKSTPWAVREQVRGADLIVGAVLVAGGKAPHVVTRDMLSIMRKGTVLVDVAIDQGGCFETSRPTSHSDPIYEVDGIIHYAVTNMPGCVPRTSTFALTNETIPFAVDIASKGWQRACRESAVIRSGLNCVDGKLTHKRVADAHGMDFTPIDDVLG